MSRDYFSTLMFQSHVFKSDGQAYQDLFTSIMEKRYSGDFRKVRAYGNIGDMKNDGFLPSKGIYYQVFAPLDISKKETISDAVSKLEGDFNGLFKLWNDTIAIKEFRFVLNDKQQGAPAPVELKIGELKKKNPQIDFGTFTNDDLLREFQFLSFDDRQSIVGFIPFVEGISTIPIEMISKTIQHLKAISGKEERQVENLIQEEFEKKISFNFLNEQIAELMKKAETQNYILEDYFSCNQDKNLKIQLRDLFVFLYKTEKEKFGELDALTSPMIFYNLLESCSINKDKESRNAAIILISYFFVSCDIYEKPIVIQ